MPVFHAVSGTPLALTVERAQMQQRRLPVWVVAIAVATLLGACGTSNTGQFPAPGNTGFKTPDTNATDNGSSTSSGGQQDTGAASSGTDTGTSSGSSGNADTSGSTSGSGGDTGGSTSGSGGDDAGTGASNDTGGNSSGGGTPDAGSSGGAPDSGGSSGTVQDTGTSSGGTPDAGPQDSGNVNNPKDTVQDTGGGGTFAKDVPWGSKPDAKPFDAGLNYKDIKDTGVTGTIPGLCTPKIAQYNIEDKKTGGKVDVIFFIDTSGSMSAEAKWINSNLNSFASYIAAKKLDYRIVLVGKSTGCCKVSPTLGNWLQPGTFMHVQKVIYSTDGLKKLAHQQYMYINSFKAFLRPDASKNWVAVTDDDSLQMTSTDFHNRIMQIKHPSNPAGPSLFKDYLFHSIVAWGPMAFKGCSTGARIGKQYLNLTAKTGGVKAKICDQNWNPIFANIAKGVIKSAKPGCTYPVAFFKNETATNGFDLKYIAKDDEYDIKPAKNNVCPANGQGFVYDKWPNPKKITICPTSCQQLKGGGNLVFNHGCL